MTIKLILFSGSYFVLMLAFGQLFVRHKNPANIILITLLIFTCIWLTQATWYFIGFADSFPHVNKTYVPFFCLCGPMWYLYVKCLFGKYKPQNKDLVYLIPSVICFLLSLAFYAQSAEFKNNYIEVHVYDFTTVSIYMATRLAELNVIISLAYSILYLLRLKRSSNNSIDPLAINLITLLTTAALCAAIIRLIGSVLNAHFFSVFIPGAIISAVFCALYCLSHRYPALLSLGFSTPKRKIKQIHDTQELQTYREKIEQEKWYLDPEIKLQQLAELLNTQPHQLSELINHSTGHNFNAFINDFRLAHAKRILLEEPQRSVLDIGYSSGFNSKSAFYKHFTHHTSMTPTQFRKTHVADHCTQTPALNSA